MQDEVQALLATQQGQISTLFNMLTQILEEHNQLTETMQLISDRVDDLARRML